MDDHEMLSEGENSELLSSGTQNDEITDQDDDQGASESDKDDDEWVVKDEEYWKTKFHKTKQDQKRVYREVSKLKSEIDQIKNAKTSDLTSEEEARLREKYDEDDLAGIEKLAERKAKEMLTSESKRSLARKEMDIFIKNNPDISDPDLKQVLRMQKEFGYSLSKAYEKISWRSAQKETKSAWIWSSFGGDNIKTKWVDKEKAEKDAAYADFEKNFTAGN